MAERLEISESQLSQYIGKTPSKHIGSAMARHIEQKLNLPEGWMDRQFPDLTDEALTVAKDFQALPSEARAVFAKLLKQLKK